MSNEKKAITRSRASYSCRTCRRRKVKCDKQEPICGGCSKVGEICEYGDAEKQSSPALKGHAQIEDDSRPRKRHAPEESDGPEDNVSRTARALELKVEQLSTLLKQLEDSSLARPVLLSAPNGGPAHNSDTKQFPLSGFWRVRGPQSTFAARPENDAPANKVRDPKSGDPPWQDVLDRLDKLNKVLSQRWQAKTTQQEDRSSELLLSHRAENPDNAAGQDSKTSTEVMVDIQGDQLMSPTGEEANVLLRSWLTSVYPVFPVFSPHTVLQKCREFDQWYRLGMDRGEKPPDPTFIPFLRCIWYTGFLALSDQAKEKWFPWLSNNQIPQVLLKSSCLDGLKQGIHHFPNSTWTIAASVLIQNLGVDSQDPMSASVHNNFSVRSAIANGMHLERSLKPDNIDNAARRRLWWEVLDADVTLSTTSGIPFVIADECTDAEMISELKDSASGTEAEAIYAQQLSSDKRVPVSPDDVMNNEYSSAVSVFHLVASARHKIMLASKRLHKVTMNAKSSATDDLKQLREELSQARNEVSNIIARIPCRGAPELGFGPMSQSTENLDVMPEMGNSITTDEILDFLRDSGSKSLPKPLSLLHRSRMIDFHRWARIMLSMLIDRADCLSYVPFLRNSRSRLWGIARNCALKACHGFMRKFINLGQDPDFSRFRWAWASLFHPMHATIVLLVDLYDRPHSEDAPISRAMIDKVLSLAGRYSTLAPRAEDSELATLPLKEAGTEAWTMFRKLRHRAWQKAGLDPEVLWDEENQVAVGIGKPLHQNDLFIRSLREDILLSHQNLCNASLSKYVERMRENPKGGRAILHPSELGAGVQAGGSVTNAVNLDELVDKAPIVLLRASHDQELMPFPTFRHTDSRDVGKPNVADMFNAQKKDLLLVGELISKIRQAVPRSGQASKNTLSERTEAMKLSQPTSMDEQNSAQHILPVTDEAAVKRLVAGKSAGINATSDVSQIVHPCSTEKQAALNADTMWWTLSDDCPQTVHNGTIQQDLSNPFGPTADNLASSQNRTGSSLEKMVSVDETVRNVQSRSEYDLSAFENAFSSADLEMSYGMEFEFDWNKWDDMFAPSIVEDIFFDCAQDADFSAYYH